MDYAIWLQILMELALAVSGEQELDLLLKKASRAFHRKLDCTHISVLQTQQDHCLEIFTSPKWAQSDNTYCSHAKRLCQESISSDNPYLMRNIDNHYYYAFKLGDYGILVLGKGQSMSLKLIRELEPILDMFATNILSCISYRRQIQIEKELRVQKDYIEHLAYYDPLTDLPNRRKFMEILNSSLVKKEHGCVILLDLDNFKRINDTLGHVFGDQVIKYLANKFNLFKNEDFFIARFGGDEFQFLIRNKEKHEIERLVQTLFKELNRIHTIHNHDTDISFSMGIALYPFDSINITQLLMHADLALSAVKKHKKSDYQFFNNTLSTDFIQKMTIEKTIKEAIVNDGFKLVYQPQVCTKTGNIIGYEALLRLKNSDLSPSQFIPVAEENKTILQIGRMVTSAVIKQLEKWISQGHDVKPISINFSNAQMQDTLYFSFIRDELLFYNVDPQLIEIEVTENIFVDNREETLILLENLRDLGIKISIDDFGTGYSSLSYLTFLPIDKIKLDRSIIVKFLELETIEVMASLIDLFHSLNLQVVAEGVEYEYQYERLRQIDCDYIQGFLFSKPLDANKVISTLPSSFILE